MDILEHKKGAAAAAISQLDQESLSSHTESRSQPLSWRLMKPIRSLLALFFRQPQTSDTLPIANPNSQTDNQAQHPMPLPSPAPDRYVCVCFPGMTYKKYLHHVDANKAVNDRQLFAALRQEYFDSKSLWRNVVSLRTLAKVEYFEVRKVRTPGFHILSLTSPNSSDCFTAISLPSKRTGATDSPKVMARENGLTSLLRET